MARGIAATTDRRGGDMRNGLRLAMTAIAAAAFGFVAGAAWLNAQDRAARRVMTLTPQDYMDIQQLYARYARAIRLGDGDAYGASFTPDGDTHVLQGDRHTTGSKAIAETANGNKRTPRRNRAWPATPVITPTADG